MSDTKIVVVSGYFDPVHLGHLDLFRAARKLGNKLIVIVNNDKQLRLKGSIPLYDEETRVALISQLKDVDKAILACDTDATVSETLTMLCADDAMRPSIFANGGDVRNLLDCRERIVCKKHGVEMIFGVGGEKSHASREIKLKFLLSVARKALLT